MNADNQVTQLQGRMKELENQNRILQEKVDYLTHKLFGSFSERTSSPGIEGQMSIFDEAEAAADPKATEPDRKDVASCRRLKFKGQREELLKDIPHEKKLCTLAELLKKKLPEQRYLHIDETSLQVLNEPGRKNTTDSYMWIYGSIKEAAQPIRFFQYQAGRSGKYPQAFLKSFQGFIHTDACKGYEKVSGLTRCFCWSHLRRYFVDALPKGVSGKDNTIPARAVEYINKLFELEKNLEILSPKGRKEQHLIQEKPVLEAFWSWAEKACAGILPQSKPGAAFTYAFNQKEGLMNYLLDGNCAFSNNLAENSIRPFTIGRKNWLFSGSPAGAAASAGIYSLIETAKANSINPKNISSSS